MAIWYVKPMIGLIATAGLVGAATAIASAHSLPSQVVPVHKVLVTASTNQTNGIDHGVNDQSGADVQSGPDVESGLNVQSNVQSVGGGPDNQAAVPGQETDQ
ncbi:hypothetical protein SAMN00768000_1396 [Sulfobacillus thermosulfidooxidans DSM 9293]|uniref:Secreted protein n=1 Tax=Sulfobacillus thermosulfidooxidans (strain DSM 9293 / VKM B-1269 / AT-1) TaxID=929705 RepID=A0A1W1WCH2_SULTA|nr:hypothetical protein [Sulfobacillus thermosulfidooxidans]SMC03994.1 hypothetical protein SAMN00768000_1396 [Sulfobacillus thermosulfidooxidans DSM 9293]